MISSIARQEAEKFRVHVLNVALAAKAGREGDLRDATEMLIGGIAKSLTDFANRDKRVFGERS